MKDLTDFAVIARSASTELSNLGEAVLRVVPLGNAPTLTEALGGLLSNGTPTFNQDQNMTLEANGSISKSNIHSVQDRHNGYVRVVARINGSTLPEGVTRPEGYPDSLTNALGFALLKGIVEGEGENAHVTGWEVLAVASLKAGCDVTDGCYVAFTFSKTNNYQSVSFSPNAFATIEDLDNINGLDGLHIAFDTASGDLKLLDKDGNVLDQANLPIKADVIIADGEEGYKYVKTDVKQDIHAAKAWMPEGKTAWETVPVAPYEMQHAALVVGKGAQGGSGRSFVPSSSTDESYPISVVTYTIGDLQDGRYILTRSSGTIGPETITDVSWKGEGQPLHFKTIGFPVTGNKVEFLVITYDGKPYLVYEFENGVCSASELANTSDWEPSVAGTIVESVTSEGSSTGEVLGITPDGKNLYTFDEDAQSPAHINNISGGTVRWLDRKPLTEVLNHTLKYGLEAFVWTVKDREVKLNEPFFQQLNASLLDLGFHEGDDIALGTNLTILAPTEGVSPLNRVDADEYMHGETKNESGKTPKELREQEVDAQRNLAQAELVAWNAQHPALDHAGLSGTRISSDGVDIRNGKIEIGNGAANADKDSVKRYVIETDIDDSVGARTDKGLQISVVDSVQPNSSEPIQKDILTINAEDYISGAPTCLALLKCSKSGDPATVSAGLEGGRITANFDASGAEVDGAFKLTITDTRKNNDFGNVTTTGEGDSVSYKLSAPRIVEIIPVYKSGADAQEAVPAQRSISAIAIDTNANGTQLTIKCSQVIDWAQSIDLDPVSSEGNPVPNGMELYLIVKVY